MGNRVLSSLNMFLAMLILFSLQLFVICEQDQVKSPHWVVVCGGAYLFSEDKKSWNDAGDICELFGGHLAQIDNLAENYCLLDYAQSQSLGEARGLWWHSGNDIQREGVYRQADRELILWTPFWYGSANSATDPNGGTTENCLGVVLTGSEFAGKWFDEACTNERYYICERK